MLICTGDDFRTSPDRFPSLAATYPDLGGVADIFSCLNDTRFAGKPAED